MFYVDQYETHKIKYRNEDKGIYAFDGGFVHVGYSSVHIELTNARRKYRIKLKKQIP